MNKPKAIVVDIDGTILQTESLFREIHNIGLSASKFRWDYFYANCNNPKIKTKQFVLDLINAYKVLYDCHLIISTARSEFCRQGTEKRLSFLSFDIMYMRQDDDFRASQCVKQDHLKAIMEDYDVRLFLDDDASNCQMAKSLGLNVFKILGGIGAE